MNIVMEKKSCASCRESSAVIYCDGCGQPLCEACRRFDLWGYGCGHVDPKAFCKKCHDDIEINPWGGKRPE
ncbi:MAG TPA: B-box zinc finger protein [Desulfatiglandales bacterium]|nr:B-box zinc finger protein [Desulfatiglandales bacterium]